MGNWKEKKENINIYFWKIKKVSKFWKYYKNIKKLSIWKCPWISKKVPQNSKNLHEFRKCSRILKELPWFQKCSPIIKIFTNLKICLSISEEAPCSHADRPNNSTTDSLPDMWGHRCKNLDAPGGSIPRELVSKHYNSIPFYLFYREEGKLLS